MHARPAPAVMVGGRDRGWGREGFGAGRQGRSAGRTTGRQDFTWRRQEWARKKPNQDHGEEVPDRDRWEPNPLGDLKEAEEGATKQVDEEEEEKSRWAHRPEMIHKVGKAQI